MQTAANSSNSFSIAQMKFRNTHRGCSRIRHGNASEKRTSSWQKPAQVFVSNFRPALLPFLPRALAGSKREIKRRELPGSLFTRNLHSPAIREKEREDESEE